MHAALAVVSTTSLLFLDSDKRIRTGSFREYPFSDEVSTMYPKIDFLYLSEPDMIAAGVLDAARCVSVCEETFSLLGKGDYLMGGANHNNHGLNIVFPKETKFPNMPVAGPDRRFAAM